jgi:hypothetical protein
MLDFGQMELYGVAVVPFIMAIVEGVKRAGFPAKWSPVLSVGLGIGGGLLIHPGDVAQGVVIGIVLGLTASGLYSGAKNVKESVQEGGEQG